MKDDFGFLKFDDYEQLWIYGPWSEELEKTIIERSVSHIYIRQWDDQTPLDFLVKYSKQIMDFKINAPGITDLSFISKLDNLNRLNINNDNINTINFSNLRRLEKLGIEGKKIGNIQDCPSLKRISILASKIDILPDLSNLINLEEFSLSEMNKLKSLKGIEHLINLRGLYLYKIPVKSLSDIENLKLLMELHLINIPIKSLEEISGLVNLRELYLDNMRELPDIKAISNLKKLTHFEIEGNTNIADGKMDYLIDLPELKFIYFKNRKHYSHTCEQIKALVEKKHNINLGG